MQRTAGAVFIIISLLWLDAAVAQRAERPGRHDGPSTLQAIRSDARSGRISTPEAIKLQFQAAFAPEKLPAAYQTLGTDHVGKCLTPALEQYHKMRSQLGPGIDREINEYLRGRRSFPDSLDSPNGLFRLHYTTSGTDSVSVTDENDNGLPDYVEKAAEYAETAWQRQVGEYGFKDPLVEGQKPYHIYFDYQNTYGYTEIASGSRNTEIFIHPTFENFPPNDDPAGDIIGSLKVTIAHEIKHAINYMYNQWEVSNTYDAESWEEMDATLIEDMVFDEVNDYYNYNYSQWSIFSQPYNSFYPASYDHATWGLYFVERFGIGYWVDVWEYIESVDNQTSFLNAMRHALDQRSASYPAEFTRNMLWHLASGEQQPNDYGFEEGANYPDPTVPRDFKWPFGEKDTSLTFNFSEVPDSTIHSPYNVDSLSAHFIRLEPSSRDQGQVQFRVSVQGDESGFGLLAYTKSGERIERLFTLNPGDEFAKGLMITWEEIEEIRVVLTNHQQNSQGLEYELEFGSEKNKLPVQPIAFTLDQNYPNPFNPATTIAFKLPDRGPVRLDLYDRTGRLVRTLVNQNMAPGEHSVTFQADGLASGIYLYRLQFNGQVRTRKMTLVK